MKFERIIMTIIILVLVYVAYTQYNSIARLFDGDFFQGALFKPKPVKTDAIKAFDKRDEVKEIMELTKLLHEVEREVNDIYDQYDIIRMNQQSVEYPGVKGSRLLVDIQNLRQTIGYDRIRIAEFKDQLGSYKSTNSSINQIKKQYIKILESKDKTIVLLQKRLLSLEDELGKKEIIIEEQAKVISEQENNIQSQEEIIKEQKEDLRDNKAKLAYKNQLIEGLSTKHVILYARKETIHIELEGNSFYLQNKINQLEIISDHPSSSYELKELKEGVTEFNITNQTAFWNNNNYLLIRVKSRKL